MISDRHEVPIPQADPEAVIETAFVMRSLSVALQNGSVIPGWETQKFENPPSVKVSLGTVSIRMFEASEVATCDLVQILPRTNTQSKKTIELHPLMPIITEYERPVSQTFHAEYKPLAPWRTVTARVLNSDECEELKDKLSTFLGQAK